MRLSVPLLAVLVLLVGACAGDGTVETTPTGEAAVSADVELGEPIALGTGDPAGLVAGSGRVWVLTASMIEPEGEFESELTFVAQVLGLDEATQEKLDDLELGELSNFEVGGLGYAADRLWVSANRQVSCAEGECVWEGRVVAIDPNTGEITHMIEVEGRPHLMGVGFGSVWVGGDRPQGGSGPSYEGNVRVDRIDPQTGAIVTSIPLHGDSLAGPKVSESGVWATVSEETRSLEDTDYSIELPYDLVWINPNTNQPEKEWSINHLYPDTPYIYMPWAMEAAFGDVWLPIEAMDLPTEVVRVDRSGNTVTRFPLDQACVAMTGCLNHMWVIDASAWGVGSAHLKGIDPETNRVAVDLDLAYLADVTLPRGLVCGDQTLWVLGGSRPDETSPVELVLIPLVP
ncbi:MAG: hypothetical protein OEM84_11490 [Acidimicrobiia bacterium]|nr:hypothetical protein [Acidimicrobiia bacterium]